MVNTSLKYTDSKCVWHGSVVPLTHRQRILGDDDSYIVDDEAVPHEQACTGGFDHQPPTVQQEKKAGQKIAQTEHADPRGARHKHHGQHKPEHVAEH